MSESSKKATKVGRGHTGNEDPNPSHNFRTNLVGQDGTDAEVISKKNYVAENSRASEPDSIRRRGRFGGGYRSTG